MVVTILRACFFSNFPNFEFDAINFFSERTSFFFL